MLSTFAFLHGLCYTKPMEGWQMDCENLEKQVIRKQNLYIRQMAFLTKGQGKMERTGRMNDQQYFQTTSLSYRLKAAERELEAFRSGEAYVKLRAEYGGVIRSQNAAIKCHWRKRRSLSVM